MKQGAVVLIAAIALCGCGWAEKIHAVSRLDASRTAYRACVAEHKSEQAQCESQRITYQADLEDAGRPRGFLTIWPWL
jgi:hypothetical protein